MIRLKDCFARDRLSSGTTCVLTSFLCKPDGRVRLSPSANAMDHSGVSADASSGASCVTHAKPLPTLGFHQYYFQRMELNSSQLLPLAAQSCWDLTLMMRLDTLPLQDRSVCNYIEVTMSVVYAVEGSSSLAHHQIVYATDGTLQHHTSCYGPSFAQAFLNACGSITEYSY